MIELPANHPGRYFAVPTPDGHTMTFWHLDRRGNLIAWPRGAQNAPALWKVPGPGRLYVIPVGLEGKARSDWISEWVRTVRAPWMDTIRSTLTADPDLAAARFASLSVVCCRCGRPLEDPESRACGLGPKCAPMVPAAIREAIRLHVGRMLAERVANDDAAAIPDGERFLEVAAP